MHKYFIKTPWLVKKIFSQYVWSLPATDKAVYLTFDDGPHPDITPWVLDELEKYNAKATFFCIGKNVVEHPAVYQRILSGGHATGNHTHRHLNGWKVPAKEYLADVQEAGAHIRSNLFRPPYGRIRKQQAGQLRQVMHPDARVIMWSVLSADFDAGFSPQACLRNVLENVRAGSIVVFHDSKKAERNLRYALPEALAQLHKNGYIFKKIVMQEQP